MKEPPSVVRYLPWRIHDRDPPADIKPASPPALYSLPPLTLDTSVNSSVNSSADTLPHPHPPPRTDGASTAHALDSPSIVVDHDEMNSASQLSLATSRAQIVDGVVRPSKPAILTSPDISTPITVDSPASFPSVVASPITPHSAASAGKNMPPYHTVSSVVVELPGSILMDNGGLPSVLEKARRGYDSDKLPSGLIKRVDDRSPGNSPTRSRKSSTIFGRCELEASSPLSPRKGDASPLSPRGAEAAREKMLARKGRVPNDSQSEIERVGKVLARRIQNLERELKERDDKIKAYEERCKKQKIAHDREIEEMAARQTKELTLLQERLKAKPTTTRQTAGAKASAGSDDSGAKTPTQSTVLYSHQHAARPADEVPSITVSEDGSMRAEEADREAVRTLERKVENAMQCVQNLREQGEHSRMRQGDLTRQLEDSKLREQGLQERLAVLEQERASLFEAVAARDQQVQSLEQELGTWKDDVDKLEGTVQKFMGAQRDMDDRDSRREEIERRCIFLRNKLSEREETIKELQATLSSRASTPFGHPEAPASPDSSGGRNLISPTSDAGRSDVSYQDPLSHIQYLEGKIRAHLEDIRLYKLDVRGYKKDVRVRDAKIRELHQTLLDARRCLAERGGDVEIPIGIELGESQGLGISPHTPSPTKARAREVGPKDLGTQTPPMTPQAAPSPRTPVSRYHPGAEAAAAAAAARAEVPPSPSPWRPLGRDRPASPSPLSPARKGPTPPQDLIPSPLALSRREMMTQGEGPSGLRPRPEGSPRRRPAPGESPSPRGESPRGESPRGLNRTAA
ncbi:MAG: hypothetical protein M1838_002253 [Thelocarpon superellum]|nr:MAG: hypothetical protein M1838_002253 [Thelocarpon superellum]